MSATEKLIAAPLPDFIADLGLAVAKANAKLSTIPTNDVIFTIPEAEIELKVAIAIEQSNEVTVGADLGLKAFSVNASYKGTFGYKEEASSMIKIKLAAKPKSS